MILDWIFSPYCSSGWIAHQAEEVFGLTLKPWNLADVRDAMYSIIPKHVGDKIKEIRRKGLWSDLQGANPLFFIDGQFIGSHRHWDTLSAEITARGGVRQSEPNIPECFVHPRLHTNREDPTIMVREVTDQDISGQGLPSPGVCLDCRFGDLGSIETIQFMRDITLSYGRIMCIAFINSDVAGFITHVPKPIAWRIGCRFVDELPEMKVLQIIDLFVYPKFRNRGVATELLKHTREFARKMRIERIEVFATINSIGQEMHVPSTGSQHPYLKQEFVKKRTILDPDGSGDMTCEGLGINQLVLQMRPV
jgi:GNAT superfamily N-acetyltransferase